MDKLLNILNIKNSMLAEAKKAKFQPNLVIQILIFIAVFAVTQAEANIPVVVVTVVKVLADVFRNRVNFEDQERVYDYAAGLMDSMTLVILFCTGIATVLAIVYCRYIEKRSLHSIGLVKYRAMSDYFTGLFIGAAMFSAGVFVAWMAGSIEYRGLVLGNSLGLVIAFFIGFLFQGMSEEVLLRGYFMMSIAIKKPIIIAILTNSVVFSLIHLANNGITFLSIINLALFGIFASVYTLKADSLWGICAIHSAWNFTQGNIYGISVSGMNLKASVLSFSPTGTNSIISGGAFGLEGGLAVTGVLVVSIIITLMVKGRNTEASTQLIDSL